MPIILNMIGILQYKLNNVLFFIWFFSLYIKTIKVQCPKKSTFENKDLIYVLKSSP